MPNKNSVKSDLLYHLKSSIRLTVKSSLGIVASGGVDSTLIAALTHRQDLEEGNNEVRSAYTLLLPGQSPASSEWVAHLCHKWNWRHHLIRVEDRHLIRAFQSITSSLDEPIGDRSLLASWILAQAIQLNHNACIGGDGADELFAGYQRYLSASTLLRENTNKWTSQYINTFLPVGEVSAIRKVHNARQYDPLGSLKNSFRGLQHLLSTNPIRYVQLLDIYSYLPGAVLPKLDRSMSYWGVEARSPFLNTRLALYALSIPTHLLITKAHGKVPLREALEDILQEKHPEIRKQGFGVQLSTDSIITRFIGDRINYLLTDLRKDSSSSVSTFLVNYFKASSCWNQNSLFSFCIYL